jgi:hypothetical protein
MEKMKTEEETENKAKETKRKRWRCMTGRW